MLLRLIMNKKVSEQLPLDTVIEVVAVRNDEVFKKQITYREALEMKRKKGFYYRFYQLGFSQY